MHRPLTPADAALQAIGWPAVDARDPRWTDAQAAFPQARPARVVEQHRSGFIVAEAPDMAESVESLPEWQRAPGYRRGTSPLEERAAVGDWVLIEGEHPRGRIVDLLPRRTAIKRGAAGDHYKQQVIAANIDIVFVVVGLDGDFNARRIERYLLLVTGSGAKAVVVLTKADVADNVPASVEALMALASQDVTVLTVNARDPESVATLHPFIPGGVTAVLVGSSGAGKSTLTNTLLGTERMKTGAVRERDAKGRHTTTHRALIPLPTGACLIDTPGMREIKPTGEEDIDDSFLDVEALAATCRFRDCTHDREPGCAVGAAIDAGTLDRARFAHYVKLRGEVAGAADKLAVRLAQQAQPRGTGRPVGRRPGGKPGNR